MTAPSACNLVARVASSIPVLSLSIQSPQPISHILIGLSSRKLTLESLKISSAQQHTLPRRRRCQQRWRVWEISNKLRRRQTPDHATFCMQVATVNLITIFQNLVDSFPPCLVFSYEKVSDLTPDSVTCALRPAASVKNAYVILGCTLQYCTQHATTAGSRWSNAWYTNH